MDNDQLPNLDPEKAGGGPAIKTKPPTLKDRLVNLARGDADDQKPTIKQGLGSFLQSKVKDISKNIVEKLVSKGVKKSVLMFILANLPTILVITAFLVIAVALTNSALKGRYGRTATQASSIYSAEDMAYIDSILNGGENANLFQNITGTFSSPFGGDNNIISFNNTLHGKSVLHPGFILKHNVYKGWLEPGTGDAVDLSLASSKNSNKPVFAMYDGTVYTKADCAVLVSDPAKYNHSIETRYCHIHDPAIGEITAGQEIAKIGKYKHVHFEVWVDGVSIHTVPSDIKKGAPYGKWLWLRMKSIFKV